MGFLRGHPALLPPLVTVKARAAKSKSEKREA